MAKIIWTNHVLERLSQRGLSSNWVTETIDNPTQTIPEKDSLKYQKTFGPQTVTAIVKKNEIGENVVVSAWVDPPNPGTKDFKKKQRYIDKQRSGNLKKFWYILLEQLGL